MTFVYNNVDMMPYLAHGGITWRRQDIEGVATGTAINGKPIRDKLAERYQWTLTFMPLTEAQLSIVLTAFKPQYATATFTDPETGNTMTDTMAYANAADITLTRETRNDIEYFSGLQVPVLTYKGA